MCSCIFWNTNKRACVVVRSLDWVFSLGDRLVIYPRGQTVTGGIPDNPARWTARYGNLCAVTYDFTRQHGLDPLQEAVTEGLNERGLMANLLYLHETAYEPRDARPGVSYARWARWVVDNFATVAEAVAAMRQVQIVPIPIGDTVYPVHLAIADPTGDSAIVEFIAGNLVIHHGRQHTVMTNEPLCPVHLANLQRYAPFGGPEEMLPGGIESSDRFVRAAAFLKTLPEPTDAAEATAHLFGLIRNVAVPFGAPCRGGPGLGTYSTWWVSAADLTNRCYFFNWTSSPNVVWVDLGALDFAAEQPICLVDPRRPELVGDISREFQPAA